MKSYVDFASEMTADQKKASRELFESVYAEFKGLSPLLCVSQKSDDVKHLRKIEMKEPIENWE